eukprot:TRINITY_DN8704_c0_g2_i1.p1 TRINITY_DN8704_c0_g2~~TRINITY_DN8704_c0_g2_i1.p1  ORF type:complete len:207 (-),score=41.01 TRINITY_DN8704_c0_g2_i1:29-649(-)
MMRRPDIMRRRCSSFLQCVSMSPPSPWRPAARHWHTIATLPDHLARTLEEAGFATPNRLQRTAIPKLIARPDVAVLHGETGSGKTLAYLAPLLATPHDAAAMVVVPTLDLVHQVSSVASALGMRVAQHPDELLGRSGEKPERRVFVGTPRLILREWLDPGHDALSHAGTIVVDEADACLLYTSDAADGEDSGGLGGCRVHNKKKNK